MTFDANVNDYAHFPSVIEQPYAIQETIPLYFWDASPQIGFQNFGDALSQVIVERLIQHKVSIAKDPLIAQKKFLAIGSILNYARNGDIVWGTGRNGTKPASVHQFDDLDVRAVRGPLTRQFLLEKGISCPEVYGDPTLLMPLLFPEFKKSEKPSHEYVIVPHFSDEHLFSDDPHMVSVKEPWDEVVKKILDSQFVIASALSGVIVAEAYGIPARLLFVENKGNTEDLFKYNDYYQGTNRLGFEYATTVEEALKMGGEPAHQCDLKKLYESFPFEYFKDTYTLIEELDKLTTQ